MKKITFNFEVAVKERCVFFINHKPITIYEFLEIYTLPKINTIFIWCRYFINVCNSQ